MKNQLGMAHTSTPSEENLSMRFIYSVVCMRLEAINIGMQHWSPVVKVIKFPRSEERKRTAERAETSLDKMYLGSFSFTCPCGNSGTFEPKNMIFRSLELYCVACGTPQKLTNPAFSIPKPPKK